MGRIARTGWRLLGASLVLWGCASQSTAGGSVSTAEAEPCPMQVASSEGAPWRAVKADGFSFCVPADWRASGARTWRGSGGSVTWSRTMAQAEQGELMAYIPGQTPLPDVRNSTEMIGGAPADVRTVVIDSKYTAAAEWRAPALLFQGSATTRIGAQRYLEIFRTVRFANGGGR